jgi:hypothetical protein
MRDTDGDRFYFKFKKSISKKEQETPPHDRSAAAFPGKHCPKKINNEEVLFFPVVSMRSPFAGAA